MDAPRQGIERQGTERQRQLNFSRGDQLWMLRESRLVDVLSTDGIKVSAGVAKAVLKAIDDFAGGRGECFASLPTIAGAAGFSLRHVKRAVAALQSMSLITCERRKNSYGIVTNHYRVVWTELRLRCPDLATPVTSAGQSEVPSRPVGGVDQSALETDQSALESDQSALEARPKCLGGTQSEIDATRSAKKYLPPPPLSAQRAWESPVVVVVDDSLQPATIEKPATAVAQATAWQEAVASLRATGLRAIDMVVAEARCRNMPPATLVEAARFYTAHREAWRRDGDLSPGVITFFVRAYHAGDDPRDWQLWPSVDRGWRGRQARSVPPEQAAARERDRVAYVVVRDGRKQGWADERIEAELAQRGLAWPGRNAVGRNEGSRS